MLQSDHVPCCLYSVHINLMNLVIPSTDVAASVAIALVFNPYWDRYALYWTVQSLRRLGLVCYFPVHLKCVLNSRDKKYCCFHDINSVRKVKPLEFCLPLHRRRISRLGLKTKSNMFLPMIAWSADVQILLVWF